MAEFYELMQTPQYSSTITSRRVTDCRMALTRGLANYIKDFCTISPSNGRDTLALKFVRDARATYEELADYPSGCVYSESAGNYGRMDGALGPISDMEDDVGNTAFVHMGEFSINLKVELWCNTPAERMFFSMAIEDIMHPVEWNPNLRLKLPHYFGVVATYALIETTYEDTSDDNLQSYWKLFLTVEAGCPFIRRFTLPNLQPRAEVDCSLEAL